MREVQHVGVENEEKCCPGSYTLSEVEKHSHCYIEQSSVTFERIFVLNGISRLSPFPTFFKYY